MRIALVHWSRRQVGGAERYLSLVLPELVARGHEVAFLAEMDRPMDRPLIPLPDQAPTWVVDEIGSEEALNSLRAWVPDLIFSHITLDPELEERVQSIAPAVFFGHAYYGTCISGTKTKSFPSPVQCSRKLGPGCLVNYYPRRCGGLNPLTLGRDYRTQRKRQELLPGYTFVLTNSEHMKAEFIRNGVSCDRIAALPMPVDRDDLVGLPDGAAFDPNGEVTLLFVGRMDRLKGGEVAIDSLERVKQQLKRSVRLVLVGDGPERAKWQDRAERVERSAPGVRIEFAGWCSRSEITEKYLEADLLVVPSLWPEPFGLVGPEAGRLNLPAVAFNSGGVADWLSDGINGYLVPDHSLGAGDLADTICRALTDPSNHLALRRGARELSRRFELGSHLRLLELHLLKAAAMGRK